MFRLEESNCYVEDEDSCQSIIYNNVSSNLLPLCKKHFLQFMKKLVRYELNAIYRHPDDAFGAMDMEGKGYIDINDFIKA